MTLSERARGWLSEPLVHFLFAGLAIFLFSSWRGEEVDPQSRRITIDEGQVSRLVAGWQQTWNRAPTQAEIDGLIREHIREEIYYREAKRLGLDEDDSIVRRRLRAKMEYLATSEIENAKPSDAVLQAWFDRNRARYAANPSYSFDQVYLPGGSGIPVAETLKRLRAGKAWEDAGYEISLPKSLNNISRAEIARTFGDQFADVLATQPAGIWTGPVPSGFGQHLVRIRAVDEGKPPELADLRQQVENDWRAETMGERKDRAYQTLLDGYTIRIAKP